MECGEQFASAVVLRVVKDLLSETDLDKFDRAGFQINIFRVYCTLTAMLTLFPADSVLHEEERLRQKAQTIGFPRVVVIPVWNLVLGAIAFLFLVVWTARVWTWLPGIWRGDNKFTVLLIVGVPLFILYAWLEDLRREVRNRSLLELGKLTVGRVTWQKTVGGKSKTSRITYVFKDDSGFERHGEGTDRSRKYREGMPLLVFFDQSDPSRSVAACCTTWRLKDPDGKFLNLD